MPARLTDAQLEQKIERSLVYISEDKTPSGRQLNPFDRAAHHQLIQSYSAVLVARHVGQSANILHEMQLRIARI